MKDKRSGITLVALVITVIIMLIVTTISIIAGKEIYNKSKVQTLETEMFAIQAKTKAYAEEIDAKIWTEDDKDTARNQEFSNKNFVATTVDQEALNQVNNDIKSDYIAYKLTEQSANEMALDIEAEEYIVIFSKTDYKKMDVIFKKGITYNKQKYYTLSSLREILEN